MVAADVAVAGDVAAGDVAAGDTSTGATPASVWRAARVPLALGVTLLLVALLVTLATRTETGDVLDPTSTSSDGGQALAVLLADRGTAVERVRTVEQASRAGLNGATLFVPVPERLSAAQVSALAELRDDGDVELVVAGANTADVERLAPGIESTGNAEVDGREPGCALPAARTAGDVDIGGIVYRVRRAEGDLSRCYSVAGDPTLVSLVPAAGGSRLTLLGTNVAFRNARLDERGNAALALGLLEGRGRVVWLLPAPGDLPPPTEADERGLLELLPDRVLLAVLQLGVAVVLLALWRVRRLGPVVREPLPVVVRAAETVEGRGRLYRAARSRDRAAESLRSGTLHRLVPALGLPPDAGPEAVVDSLSARTGRPPGAIGGLLYGAPPPDDTHLVRLADDLDALDREVRRP